MHYSLRELKKLNENSQQYHFPSTQAVILMNADEVFSRYINSFKHIGLKKIKT